MSERLSFSQLSSYARCPEQYRLERVVKVPQTPSWALVGGSAVHVITERRDLLEHGVEPDGTLDFEEEFEAEVSSREEESGMGREDFRASGRRSKEWPNKENHEWWLKNGPLMVDRWTRFSRNFPHPLWITPTGEPGVEVPFEYAVPDTDIVVRGVVDRVHDLGDGTLLATDIKTGASKQPSMRQLGVYKVALEQKYPGHTVKFGMFWDGRSGVGTAMEDLDAHIPERLSYQMRALSIARKAGIYLANPSNMCVSCSVRDYCYEITPDAMTRVRPPWVAPDEWGAPDFIEVS